ncbi:MAG: hypothetical protein R3E96_14855 [Planctomycetota bacterium]
MKSAPSWGVIFDDPGTWPKEAQSFNACVDATHASWLLDTGMFQNKRVPNAWPAPKPPCAAAWGTTSPCPPPKPGYKANA